MFHLSNALVSCSVFNFERTTVVFCLFDNRQPVSTTESVGVFVARSVGVFVARSVGVFVARSVDVSVAWSAGVFVAGSVGVCVARLPGTQQVVDIPVHVPLQSKHYHRNKIEYICTYLNNVTFNHFLIVKVIH